MTLISCASKASVPLNQAISSTHENGCVCPIENVNEYEFIGVDTLVEVEDTLTFCVENEFISAGTLNQLEREYAEGSLLPADSCVCEGIAPEDMELVALMKLDRLEAIGNALFECQNNYFESISNQEPS